MIKLSLERINAKSPYEVKEANPNRFTIRTTHATVEGQELYVAIIVENRNSRLQAITDEFDSTVAALADKPV